MSSKLKSILRFIVKNYSYPDDLTKTRITKIVYLIDWEYALKFGQQLTSIKWYFNHFGPYVSDVLDVADEDKNLRIRKTFSAYGTVKYIVESKNNKDSLICRGLSVDDEDIIKKVISETQDKNYNEFIDYVYETYPVKNVSKYNELDLVRLANEYKKDSNFIINSF